MALHQRAVQIETHTRIDRSKNYFEVYLIYLVFTRGLRCDSLYIFLMVISNYITENDILPATSVDGDISYIIYIFLNHHKRGTDTEWKIKKKF